MPSDNWRVELRSTLERFFGRDKDDVPPIECCMAILSAYTTVRSVITSDKPLSMDDKAGVTDMLHSLTSGLALGNPFWAKHMVFLMPVLALVNVNLVHAYQYSDADKDGKVPALNARIVECLNMIHQFPLLVLFLHRGPHTAEAEGGKLKDEVSRILNS